MASRWCWLFWSVCLIRVARIQQNLTQEKLAELSELSLNFISSLERTNTNRVSIKNATQIANALGMNLTDLLSSPDEHNDDNYPNTKRLNYMLQNLPKNTAETYAKAFIDILKINNKPK